MGLLDDLKAAGQALDIQFQPSSNEVQSVVGAIVHYLEHGDEFLKAAEAGVDDVAKLLAPPPEEQAQPAEGDPTSPADSGQTSPAPVSSAPSLSDEELDKQIADLEAQRAARRATSQQTQVTHEVNVSDPSEPAAPVELPPSPPSTDKPPTGFGRFLHHQS